MGIRREYDSVGKGDLPETENEKRKKGKKDKRYFEISMIRQIPLNRTESNQPSLSPYQIVLIWLFFLIFWLWFVVVIVVVVIIVSHLFLSIVFFFVLLVPPCLSTSRRQFKLRFQSLSAGEMIDGHCTRFDNDAALPQLLFLVRRVYHVPLVVERGST